MFIRRLHPKRFDRRTLFTSLAVALLALAGFVIVLRSDVISTDPQTVVFEDPAVVEVDGSTVGGAISPHPGISEQPKPTASPNVAASPEASLSPDNDPSLAVLQARLLAVRDEPLSEVPGQMRMPYGTRMVSVQLELTADRDLPADPGRATLVITDSNGDVIRAAPTLHPELAPNLSEVDLKAGETVTGWLSFVVPPSTHQASLSLRPIGNMAFVVELPIEW